MKHQYFVYILECSDESYYTGVTNNYKKRKKEHNDGKYQTCYTYSRRPLKLVYVEEHKYINDAIAREKQIKKWSRKKKIALINDNPTNLIFLSKRKTTQEKIKNKNRD
ncbi:GIY-YIG nuclease family protein [Candidatus Kuenenbacteria bacterium]|nr:GIY-YIG nuclease family protein [Candidatus Kuenenbacteria bacterium]